MVDCLVDVAAFVCVFEDINFGNCQVEVGQQKRMFLLEIIVNEVFFSRNYKLFSRVKRVEVQLYSFFYLGTRWGLRITSYYDRLTA